MAHTTISWIWDVWRVGPGQQSRIYQPLISPPLAVWWKESEEQNQENISLISEGKKEGKKEVMKRQ